jgi:predicted nucleic acid-binding protein
MIVYVETSALTPLIKKEDQSATVRSYLGDLVDDGHVLLTGRLTETELRRAAHRYGAPQSQATIVLEALVIEEQTPSHFKLAGTIGSAWLRSLDALHVATAVASNCTAMITLDARVHEAAVEVGIPVLDPSRPVQRDL